MRLLRLAYLLEQASSVAMSALVVAMLIERGVDARAAGFVLAASGLGKVAGRVVPAGRIGRASPALLATTATAVHAVAVVGMLASTTTPWLYLAGVACGAAAGTSSVLRPLIVARHVPLDAFASANARLQTPATLARALGPVVVGIAAAQANWGAAWTIVAGGLAIASGVCVVLAWDAHREPTSATALGGINAVSSGHGHDSAH